MKVMKLTTKTGVYYNNNYSPELIRQTLMKAPEWEKIELIEMSEKDYLAVPATSESAALFAATS